MSKLKDTKIFQVLFELLNVLLVQDKKLYQTRPFKLNYFLSNAQSMKGLAWTGRERVCVRGIEIKVGYAKMV
jgi:hypothetical protein